MIMDKKNIDKIVKSVSDGAKTGLENAAKGAKIGIDFAAKGAKTGAEVASKAAKSSVKKIEDTVEEITAQSETIDGHTVLRFKNAKILIPDGYILIKDRKILAALREMYGLKKIETAFMKQTNSSADFAVFFYNNKHSMDFEDKEKLISGIHDSLHDSQGLIEVKNGKTTRGGDYIYSIVKTVGDGDTSPMGVRYFLRMNIRYGENILEVMGSFEEIGMTGTRESMSGLLAQKAGIWKIGDEGWNEDPYDAEYKKGNPKNLAEKESLDGLFPGNPLSQAREFVMAVIKDELVFSPDDSGEKSGETKEAGSKETTDVKNLFVDECLRKTYVVEVEAQEEENEKKENLDEKLQSVIDSYNAQYAQMSDKGSRLYTQRERAVDLLQNVENLINSIANHPKEFDKDIEEIFSSKQSFTDTCDYARMELEAAKKSAVGAGVGVTGGMAVASVTPSVAMWVATTFGTASTGTAISTLSGAAATNAALAWLGGGTLAAGGGGMAMGKAFLAMAGPIGWGVAGATLLTSVVLFVNKKVKLSKQKKEEIESVLANTEKLKEADLQIKGLLDKTETLRDSVNAKYNKCLVSYGKNYLAIAEEDQMRLGMLVNMAKSLASTLGEGVEI
jgi:hypothetical protein